MPSSDPVEELERKLTAIKADKRPVIVGPWTSEVGFEVLYWIPFLRWLRDRHGVSPDRVVVISRGGTASWYRGVGSRYVDIFEFVSVDEFRAMSADRWAEGGGQKHVLVSPWDRRLLVNVSNRLDLAESHVLHPAIMYRLFRSLWLGRMRISDASQRLMFERLAPPAGPSIDGYLPDGEFVAARFYARPSFPDDTANRQFACEFIETVARRWPVVLLNTGFAIDDHVDFDTRSGHRVTGMVGAVAPESNLALQTAIISRARAFVGTYGGLGYVATAHGIPAMTFASAPETIAPSHVAIGQLAAQQTGASHLLVRTADTDIVRFVVGVSSERVPRGGAGPSNRL